MNRSNARSCQQSEITCAYALQVLPEKERASSVAHIASCAECQCELESLRGIVKRFVAWPADVLRPSASLRDRLAQRIGGGEKVVTAVTAEPRWSEPRWQEVASGIECKILAHDTERNRVSMLVRLAPGASYPAHTHADVEELHLLDGELWIDQRKLYPGDYNYGPPGAMDHRVWSETGCTCVLVTSMKDKLR